MVYPVKFLNKKGELVFTFSGQVLSKKMWGEYNPDPLKKKKNRRVGKRKVICAFQECKKEAWVVSGKARFCSNLCASRSNNEIKKRERAARRDNRPPKICIKCGKEFKAKYSNSQYCNDPCRGEWLKRKMALKSNKTKE